MSSWNLIIPYLLGHCAYSKGLATVPIKITVLALQSTVPRSVRFGSASGSGGGGGVLWIFFFSFLHKHYSLMKLPSKSLNGSLIKETICSSWWESHPLHIRVLRMWHRVAVLPFRAVA